MTGSKIDYQALHNVAIWGYGREGQSSLDWIRKHAPQARITILSDNRLCLEDYEQTHCNHLYGGEALKALCDGRFDLVIKSPGISNYRPGISQAKRNGVRFTSATNLWFEAHTDSFKVAVTGTKGKSTSAMLLRFLLERAGKDVQIFGNIGLPMLGREPGADVTVLELSSYQIADLSWGVDVALVTNIYPDHLPWHDDDEERYYQDKLRLLSLKPDCRVIANAGVQMLKDRISDQAHVTWFNDSNRGYRVCDGKLLCDDDILDVSNYPLKGDHNLVNLAGVCAVLDQLGVDPRPLLPDLGAFVQLPHRLEHFTRPDGILCINDSIATVPESTIAALETLKSEKEGQCIFLILGGAEREQDYQVLYNYLQHMPPSQVSGLYLLPENGQRMLEEMKNHPMSAKIAQALPQDVPEQSVAQDRLTVTICADLKQAIDQCLVRAVPGDIILLSPAAPSFGQFRNFEHRGQTFKALCLGEWTGH